MRYRTLNKPGRGCTHLTPDDDQKETDVESNIKLGFWI